MFIQFLNFIYEMFFSYIFLSLNSFCSFFISSSQNISLVFNSILINDTLINILICFLTFSFTFYLSLVLLTKKTELLGKAIAYGAGLGTIGMAGGWLPPNKDDEDKKAEEEARRKEEEAKRAAHDEEVKEELLKIKQTISKVAADIEAIADSKK